MYNAVVNDMNGKKVFKTLKKPQDLYRLPSDDIVAKQHKLDKERQTAALEKFKNTDQYKEWLIKT